jgi:hypothetical protein
MFTSLFLSYMFVIVFAAYIHHKAGFGFACAIAFIGFLAVSAFFGV